MDAIKAYLVLSQRVNYTKKSKYKTKEYEETPKAFKNNLKASIYKGSKCCHYVEWKRLCSLQHKLQWQGCDYWGPYPMFEGLCPKQRGLKTLILCDDNLLWR